jgi:hypothetical protein
MGTGGGERGDEDVEGRGSFWKLNAGQEVQAFPR